MFEAQVLDYELIEKIKTEDSLAFKELFDRYKKLVINLCFKLVRNNDEAEDLTQDVFFKIYQSAKAFRHGSKVSTWIYRIAINNCLNHLRKKKYLQWFSLDDCSESTEDDKIALRQLHSDEFPEQSLEKKEQESIILKAIHSLPKHQRIAVILQRYEGLSCQEIAEILDCSIGAVQARLHRAKKSLYHKLLPFLDEF